MCWDTAQALVFLLVSQHSPSLGVLAGVNVMGHSPSLGVLAGVSVMGHSPSLGVLAGVSVLGQPKPWCSCLCRGVGTQPQVEAELH